MASLWCTGSWLSPQTLGQFTFEGLLVEEEGIISCVHENTCSQTQISNAVKKVKTAAIKYCIAHRALITLAPILGKDDKWCSELWALEDDDICGLPVVGLGEGKRVLSWIWTPGLISSDEAAEPQMVDGLIFHFIKLILLIAPFPSSTCSMVPRLSTHYEVDWRNYVSSGGNVSGVLILIMVWKLVVKPYRCRWHEAIWSILIGRNCSICGMTGTLEGIPAG